jgi:hypothetical protein
MAGAAAARARSISEQQQFPAWSDDYVDRMLTDSPWAKPLTIGFNLQAGAASDDAAVGFFPGITRPDSVRSRRPQASRGSGARTEIYLTARWASALPIRQAYAIQDFGRGGLDSPEVIQRLFSEPAEYVLELAGFPTILFKKGSQELEDSLAASAITVPGRPPVAPNSVIVPAHGMHLMATMRFPRFANLQPGDGSITLTASAGMIYIEHGFRLKSMVYQSRLEL